MLFLFLTVSFSIAFSRTTIAYQENENLFIPDTIHLRDSIKILSLLDMYKNVLRHQMTNTSIVDILHPNTIKYFTDMLELTLFIDSATLRTLPVFDIIFITSLRHRLTKDSMFYYYNNINDYIQFILTDGDKDWKTLTIATLSFTDTSAIATLNKDNKVLPKEAAYIFYTIGDKWVLDLTNFFDYALSVMQLEADRFNKLMNQGKLEEVFKTKYHKIAENNIWQPIITSEE
jgi:hypothetical protein